MSSRLPSPRKRKTEGRQKIEQGTQGEIVQVLELVGLKVYHTSAFRQKGPSGVSKGIPDLLIAHPFRRYSYIGIEVKKPGKVQWSSPEQQEAHSLGEFILAQSPEDALRGVLRVLGPESYIGGKITALLRSLAAA